MLIVKSIKRTLVDSSVVNERWIMVLHRVIDEVMSPQGDIMQPVYLELQDTETGEVSKLSFSRYSKLIKMLTKRLPYGFIETQVTQYRGDFLIAIDKLALEFIEYVDSVDFVEIPLYESQLINSLMRESNVSFRQLDKHGTLFTGDSYNGTFACTLLDAICLSSRVLVGGCFYLPFTKARISRDSVSYHAFKVSFKDMRRAKTCLAKAFTLRSSSVTLQDTEA